MSTTRHPCIDLPTLASCGPLAIGVDLSRPGSDSTVVSVYAPHSVHVVHYEINTGFVPREARTDDMRQMVDDLEAHGGAPKLTAHRRMRRVMSDVCDALAKGHRPDAVSQELGHV